MCIQSISKGDISRQMAGHEDARTPLPAFCTSSDGHLLIYQVSFDSLLHFQRYAPDKLFISKIKKESNSVITCDRVTVLALCTSSDGRLSMYQVSFNSFFNFRDMLRTTLLLQKLRREGTGYSVMILAFCNSTWPSISVSSSIYLSFRDMLRTSLHLQKLEKEITL